jgi:hypothetical protein
MSGDTEQRLAPKSSSALCQHEVQLGQSPMTTVHFCQILPRRLAYIPEMLCTVLRLTVVQRFKAPFRLYSTDYEALNYY